MLLKMFYLNRLGALMTRMCFVLLCVLHSGTGAYAGPIDDCNSDDVAQRQAGCSAIIKKGGLEKAHLAIAYSRRSDAYMENGKLDEAIADRIKATELAPKDKEYKDSLVDAYVQHADRFIEKKLFGKAISDLNAVMQIKPNAEIYAKRLIMLHELRGLEQQSAKNHKGAIASYTQALKIDASRAMLFIRRAEAYRGAGDERRALSDYAEAIRLDPDNIDVYSQRSEVHVALGNKTKAIADLNEVIKRNPQDIGNLLVRAFLNEDNGNREEAAKDYRSVLKIQPLNKDAKVALERVKRTRAQLIELIQTELKRVGCDPGTIDGQWGRKGKSALAAYARHAEQSELGDRKPNEKMLTRIREKEGRVCPEKIKKKRTDVLRGGKKTKKKKKLSRLVNCCIYYASRTCRESSKWVGSQMYSQLAKLCSYNRTRCLKETKLGKGTGKFNWCWLARQWKKTGR